MKRSTWNHVQAVDGCTNCKRAEHDHVWICACGRELSWADELLPVNCQCGTRNAMLYCPKKHPWSTAALVVSISLAIGYLIGWFLGKAFQ
jgi:hypothetical protein